MYTGLFTLLVLNLATICWVKGQTDPDYQQLVSIVTQLQTTVVGLEAENKVIKQQLTTQQEEIDELKSNQTSPLDEFYTLSQLQAVLEKGICHTISS